MLGLHSERLFIDPDRLAKEGGLSAVPADSVACFRTHDMEPFAALYENGELGAYRDALEAFLETAIPDHERGPARRLAAAARPFAGRISRSPTSTTSSARRHRTTCPARSCRRSGGAGSPVRPRRRWPIRGFGRTSPPHPAGRIDGQAPDPDRPRETSTSTCSTRGRTGTCTTCSARSPGDGGTRFSVWAPSASARRRRGRLHRLGIAGRRSNRSGCRESGRRRSPARPPATGTATS